MLKEENEDAVNLKSKKLQNKASRAEEKLVDTKKNQFK